MGMSMQQMIMHCQTLCICIMTNNIVIYHFNQSLDDLQTFEVFQGSYSSPTLNHGFGFWLAERL